MKKFVFLSLLTIVIFSSFAFLILYSFNEKLGMHPVLASSVNSNASVVSEGDSTYFGPDISDVNVQNVSTVIVIPNRDSSSSNSNENSLNVGRNESLTTDMNKKDHFAPPLTLEEEKEMQNETTKPKTSNATQRGEYKVDDNGVHYYDINNCSLVKGSSGIGDLSECEDAERVIKKEQRG